jgi:hypothetical protein
MTLRPARTGASSMSIDPQQTAQAELRKLKQDPNRIRISYIPNESSSEVRVLFQDYPRALAIKFSPYLAAKLAQKKTRIGTLEPIPKTSTVCITGGSHDALKAVLNYFLACADNTHQKLIPSGPKVFFFMRMHEAADLLDVDDLAGKMIGEAITLLETPITEAELIAVAKNFTSDSPYAGMALDNLASAISNWDGNWSDDHPAVNVIQAKRPDLFQLLSDRLSRIEADRILSREKAQAAYDKQLEKELAQARSEQKGPNKTDVKPKTEAENKGNKETPVPAPLTSSWAQVARGAKDKPQSDGVDGDKGSHKLLLKKGGR